MEWFFSMTTPDHLLQTWRKRPFRNSTGIGDPSTSALISGPCPIGLPPLLLSLQQSASSLLQLQRRALQNCLDEFFAAKPANFLKRGIKNLNERWEAVVSNGGEYINWLCDYFCKK
jgi:hypothetical protein